LARLLRHFVAEPSRCAYLPDRDASLEYRLMLDIIAEELDHLLERGWRRFGLAYFRPACGPCNECVPLRIPVASFKASRNQKRTWNRGKKTVRVEIGSPAIDQTRLDLYALWHDMQGSARGWSGDVISEEEYYHQFAFPHPCVREFAYYDDDKLIAVSIVDETPRALSAVYTYHHPDYRRLSLGTMSILWQIAFAKKMKKRFVYLGYRVLGCQSSEYKARFGPHELLVGWPGLTDTPSWKLSEDVDE
jgi:arginine-tRNA-protein transferase